MKDKLQSAGKTLLEKFINTTLLTWFSGLIEKMLPKPSGESGEGGANSVTDGIFGGIFGGIFDSLKGIFTNIFSSISGWLSKGLESLAGFFTNLLGKLFGGLFSAQGNAFGAQGVLPYAHGGVVTQPTLFGFAHGIGLMGEKGAEAIMPLGRDSRGNLGVRVADMFARNSAATAGSGGTFAPHIEINVENNGGGDMTEEQARVLGAQIRQVVELQVAKQLYEYTRGGMLRSSYGMGY